MKPGYDGARTHYGRVRFNGVNGNPEFFPYRKLYSPRGQFFRLLGFSMPNLKERSTKEWHEKVRRNRRCLVWRAGHRKTPPHPERRSVEMNPMDSSLSNLAPNLVCANLESLKKAPAWHSDLMNLSLSKGCSTVGARLLSPEPSFKIVRFRRITVVLFVAFLLLLVLPVALWFATAESRRVAVEVQQLVSELEKDDAQNKLIALGPKAYGELRRILLYRADNKWARWYNRLWAYLPPSVRDQLPAPGARTKLRDHLQVCLDFAGPVVCRAMAGTLCTALERDDYAVKDQTLLSPLLWSIPDSPYAVMILSNYLARPTNHFFLSYGYTLEPWFRDSNFAPLYAQWLRNGGTVEEAARGLLHLGTNAAFALPLLVEVAETGVASPPIYPATQGPYRAGFDPVATRRSVGIRALGRIGVTNSAVMQALNKASEYENDELRSAVYLATLQLELPMSGQLQTWADQWNPIEAEQQYPLKDSSPSDMTPPYAPPQFLEEYETLQAIGELGPKAARAVPLLDRIASATRTNAAARLDEFDPRQADRMRLAAVSALYQIDPNRAAPHLPFVLEHFAQWEARDLLRQWRALREQIIPPMLELQNRRLDAAFILHGVAPELEEPRRILETTLTSDHLETRAIALNWLWLLRQDVAQLLPVARELLKTSDEKALRSALIVLEKMGDAARPAIPELKPLLVSKHGTPIRNLAGYLLRRLSPADMPPIIE